jgi:hypothetical protein
MDNIKDYLISVGLKKYAPTVVMAVFTALGTLLAAHAGMLEQWGVNYIASWDTSWLATHSITGPVLLVELDTTSTSAIAAIVGLIALWSRGVEYHTAVKPPKETA